MSILRYRQLILGIFLVLIVILALLLFLKKGYISNHFAETNKELVSFLTEIIKTLVVLVIGVFSFFRFFLGHLFRSTFQVDLKCQSIEIGNQVVHNLYIILKNNGPFTEYKPYIEVTTYKYGEDENIIKPLEVKSVEDDSNYVIILPNTSHDFLTVITYDKEETIIYFKVVIYTRRRKGKITKKIAQKNCEVK